MDERLVVNVSRFPYETVDGETILIDSETGHVLLLAGFAAVLWDHLVAGDGLEALISAVNARFGTEAGAATRRLFTGASPGRDLNRDDRGRSGC